MLPGVIVHFWRFNKGVNLSISILNLNLSNVMEIRCIVSTSTLNLVTGSRVLDWDYVCLFLRMMRQDGVKINWICLTCPVVLSLFGNGLMGEISWRSEGGWLIGIGKRLDWRQWREHEINLDRERGRRTPSTPGSIGETNCGPSMRAPWTNRRIWTRSLSEQLPSQPGFGHRCRICPLILVCIVATSFTNTRCFSLSLHMHQQYSAQPPSTCFHLLPSFHRVSHMCAIYLALKRTRLFRDERAWISVVTKEIVFRSISAGYLLLCRRN
jgi:hypothetical protein